MNGLLLALAIVTALALGMVVYGLVWRGAAAQVANPAVTLGLGIGLGLGLSSVLFFFWLLGYGIAGRGFVAAEAVAIVALALWLRRFGAKKQALPPAHAPCPRWLLWGAGATLCLFIAGMSMRLMRFPHGLWDAWSIWNLRARFLFRGGEHWRDGFDPLIGWSHPDYPLLIPSSVARAWSYLGHDDPLAPGGLSVVFAVGLAALVFGIVWQLRDKALACVALLILFSPAVFLRHAASQYADVPLGFFIAAACTSLLLADRQQDRCAQWLLVAGLMAGLAAWTKNEGLLFFVCFLSAYGTAHGVRGNWRTAARGLAWLILGAAPVFAAIVTFKLTLAPVNDLLVNYDLSELAAKAGQTERHTVILTAMLEQAAGFGKACLLLVPLYLLAIGVHAPSAGRSARHVVALSLVLQLSGYYAVYLFTHLPLQWHLDSSLTRLYSHLWPAAVLLLCLYLRSPVHHMTAPAPVQGDRDTA